MPLFRKYLKTQFKRGFCILPSIFFSFALFLICLGIPYLFLLSRFNPNLSGNQKIRIAIIGDKSNPYFDFIMKNLPSLDYSKNYVDILSMDEKTAEKQLNAGKIMCYAVIPDTFLDSVMYGYNDTQITIVTGSGQKDFIDQIIQELSEIISIYINHAQSAAFSVEKIIIEQNRMEEYDKLMTDINFSYVDYVLSRSDFAIIEKKSNSKEISFSLYYACSLVIILLMHISIITCSFFTKRNSSSRLFFKSKGLSVGLQMLCEYSVYFFIFTICSILILFFLYLLCRFGIIKDFPIYEKTNPELGMILLFFKLIPLFIMISLIQFVSYEFISDLSNGILFQFLLILFLCFFGGAFYPLSFFSKPIEIMGKLTPAGNCLSYLINSIMHKDFTFQMLLCIFYSLILSLLTLFKRNPHER